MNSVLLGFGMKCISGGGGFGGGICVNNINMVVVFLALFNLKRQIKV